MPPRLKVLQPFRFDAICSMKLTVSARGAATSRTKSNFWRGACTPSLILAYRLPAAPNGS
jgi:hypothetical protein